MVEIIEGNWNDQKRKLKKKFPALNEYQMKMDTLSRKNDELKMKITAYKQDGKQNWNSFKNEFSHDMDKLGESLKDFTQDNKN